MRKDFIKTFTLLLLITMGLVGMTILCHAEDQTTSVISIAEQPSISLIEGDDTQLPIEGLKRFVVGSPNLVGAESTEKGLKLIGKRPGQTIVAIWADAGRSTYKIEVLSRERMNQTAVIAAPSPIPPEISVTLQPGGSEIIRGQGITRTAVSNPNVLNIVPISTTEILVNAVKVGISTVRVWDDNGLATYNYTVMAEPEKPVVPGPSPEEIAANITKQIDIPTIAARLVGDLVVLTGTASSADIAAKAALICEACGKKCVNLVTIEQVTPAQVVAALKAALPSEQLTYEILPDQTVMIRGTVASVEQAVRIQDVVVAWLAYVDEDADKTIAASQVNFDGKVETPAQVVDRSRTEAAANGVVVTVGQEYNFARKVFGGRVSNGPRIVAVIEVNPACAKQILVRAQVIEVDRNKLKKLGVDWGTLVGGVFTPQPVTLFQTIPPPVPLGELGEWARNPLAANIQALINEDAARILSEPRLLIVDGHSANILVGGEIPIPVAQNVTVGSSAITVIYKQFGIQLTVKPKITQDSKILMTVSPEVSSLDFTNAVQTTGFTIPAITTRRATTTVHMDSCQSLIIGGLLSSEDIKNVQRIPFISKIPLVGELFKHTTWTKNRTELVIIITPEIQDVTMNPPDAQSIP